MQEVGGLDLVGIGTVLIKDGLIDVFELDGAQIVGTDVMIDHDPLRPLVRSAAWATDED